MLYEKTLVMSSLMRWGLPPVGLSHVADRVTVFPSQTLSTSQGKGGMKFKGRNPQETPFKDKRIMNSMFNYSISTC